MRSFIHLCNKSDAKLIFIDFCVLESKNKTESKQLKQKRQKQNYEKCFANIK
jgi:hypothetical protein